MPGGKRALSFIKENPTGKRPLGRPRLRWEERIKKDDKEVEPKTK
jgi:hypothetical protein